MPDLYFSNLLKIVQVNLQGGQFTNVAIVDSTLKFSNIFYFHALNIDYYFFSFYKNVTLASTTPILTFFQIYAIFINVTFPFLLDTFFISTEAFLSIGSKLNKKKVSEYFLLANNNVHSERRNFLEQKS